MRLNKDETELLLIVNYYYKLLEPKLETQDIYKIVKRHPRSTWPTYKGPMIVLSLSAKQQARGISSRLTAPLTKAQSTCLGACVL